MKKICCACGKIIRMSAILGNEGHELSGKAYACYDCCKIAGIGKGFMGAMSTAFKDRDEFLREYNAAIEKENLRKQEELELQRRLQEERQAKIESAKKAINFVKGKIIGLPNEEPCDSKNEIIPIEELPDEELIEKMNSFIVENPGVMLNSGEKCFYKGPCYSGRLKNVVTGTSGSSLHIGGKNALGIYMGTGTSQRNYDRRTVIEKYPGHFYITNNRMICSAPKLAFEIKLTSITSLTTYSDALIITVKDKSYMVETEDIEYIKELISVNNEGIKRGLHNDGNTTKSDLIEDNDTKKEIEESSIIQLLREYKMLCDEGVITEEEFLNKKKQLLGQ